MFLALVISAVSAVATAGWLAQNRYFQPARIEEFLSHEVGRKVRIEGPVTFSFWSGPKLTMQKIKIQNPPNSPIPDLIRSAVVSVGVSWLQTIPALMGWSSHFLQIQIQDGHLQLASSDDLTGSDGAWPSVDDSVIGMLTWLDRVHLVQVKLEIESTSGKNERLFVEEAKLTFRTGSAGAVLVESNRLDVRSGQVRITGKINLKAPLVSASDSPTAFLTGRLKIDSINLADWDPNSQGRVLGDSLDHVLSPHVCRSWDTDIAIVVNSVRLRVGEAKEVRAHLRSDEGHWKFEVVSTRLPIGHGEGKLNLACGELPAEFDLRASIQSRGNQSSHDDVTDIQIMGEMDALLSVSAKGDSGRDILENLKGQLSIFLGPVETSRLYDDLYARSLYHALTVSWDQSSRTVVDCALLDMTIKSGIGHFDEMLFATPKLIVEGQGNFNFSDGKIDAVLVPKFKTSSFVSLHMPVRIDGWIADPNVGVDWKSFFPRLSQQALISVTAPLLDNPFFQTLGEQEKISCRRALEPSKVSAKARD